MSSYQPTQVCTPEDKLLVIDAESEELVYAYCTVHGQEAINPLYDLFYPGLIEQLRKDRDKLLKRAKEEGKDPHYGMVMSEVKQSVDNAPGNPLLN
jgi:hypothetical protein